MELAFKLSCKVEKIEETLGLVMGWAMVSDVDGADYFDLQDDHIPQDVILKSSVDFMENSRVIKEGHDGSQRGHVVFAFPVIDETCKAFGLTCEKRGLMVAVRPDDEMLAKFKSGESDRF